MPAPVPIAQPPVIRRNPYENPQFPQPMVTSQAPVPTIAPTANLPAPRGGGGGGIDTSNHEFNPPDKAGGYSSKWDPALAPPGQQQNYASNYYKEQEPGMIAGQVGAAQDAARRNLARDIQGAKASANARGMLYSGQEAEGEQTARAREGSQLAVNIQDINAKAKATEDYKSGMALSETAQNTQHDVGMATLQAQAAQTAYEQALQEQANSNSYYSSIAQSAGGLLGTIAGSLIGGPVGGAIGGAIGSAVGSGASQ